MQSKDCDILSKAVLSRTKLLRISPSEYRRILLADSNDSVLELRELVRLLTVGESYFFRDAGQFGLLKMRILPELIRNHKEDRRLRVWSAGCSTGEEPYSIAILISELIQNRGEWNISILGTDIKSDLLDKARKGMYGAWSFRQVDPAVQRKYFTKTRNEWALDEQIMRMVEFRTGDLLNDDFPDYAKGLYDVDLIICRNVFIYYQAEAVAAIVRKFADTLNEGGYLMTGHGELYSVPSAGMRQRLFPESLVYEKAGKAAQEKQETVEGKGMAYAEENRSRLYAQAKANVPAGAAVPGQMKETGRSAPETLTAEAAGLMKNGLYNEAIEKLKAVLAEARDHFSALCLISEAFANLRKYEAAAGYLRHAIEADRFAAEPYLLLARIAEEKGDTEAAKDNLKKVLYLKPGYVAAYLELAAIYENEDDAARAQKLRRSALEILETRNMDETVEPYEATAGELRDYLKRVLVKKPSH